MNGFLLIGLTGGIGTGKSEVAAALEKLGAIVINADDVGRWVMDNNQELIRRVRDIFGGEYFDDKGRLKRKKLGDLVFSHPDKKKLLDEMIFPPLYQKLRSLIAEAGTKHSVVVVDAAMIFEWGIEKDFDLLLTVTAPETIVFQRLSRRDDFSMEQVRYRMESQLPPDFKAASSHAVIVNDSTLEELREAVRDFWAREVKPRLLAK